MSDCFRDIHFDFDSTIPLDSRFDYLYANMQVNEELPISSYSIGEPGMFCLLLYLGFKITFNFFHPSL